MNTGGINEGADRKSCMTILPDQITLSTSLQLPEISQGGCEDRKKMKAVMQKDYFDQKNESRKIEEETQELEKEAEAKRK